MQSYYIFNLQILITGVNASEYEVVVQFAPCDKRICVEVPIVDDETVEKLESFNITLERTPDMDINITLDQVVGVVEITENDGKYD